MERKRSLGVSGAPVVAPVPPVPWLALLALAVAAGLAAAVAADVARRALPGGSVRRPAEGAHASPMAPMAPMAHDGMPAPPGAPGGPRSPPATVHVSLRNPADVPGVTDRTGSSPEVGPRLAPRPSAGLDPVDAELFARLNGLRRGAGAPPVAEDARLAAAAARHAAWLLQHRRYTHVQQAGTAGFAGATPRDRVAAEGFPPDAGVDEAYVLEAATPADCIGWLAASVYHLAALVAPAWRAAGAAQRGDACVLVLGDARLPAALAGAGGWQQWPADGSADAAPRFRPASERPDPAPDLAWAGQPVLLARPILGPPGATFEIARFTLEREGDGDPTTAARTGERLAARVLAAAATRVAPDLPRQVDDRIGDDQVVLLPLAPLAPGATYVVTASGQDGAQPFVRRWSFRAGGG